LRDWHCACSSLPVQAVIEQGGQLMTKATMFVLTLIALLVGVTGCAKYPVVVNASASAPAPATHAPAQ
jgi:hypothetical protein